MPYLISCLLQFVGIIAVVVLLIFFVTGRISQDEFQRQVALGGGIYRGLQRENDGWYYGLVLFNSPATGSTLALPLNKVTAANVRAKIAESDAKFLHAEKI